MKKQIGFIASVSLVLSGIPMFVAPAAQALDPPKPAKSVCSEGPTGNSYACMKVDSRRVPSGDTVTFTGTLSAAAQKNLRSWTRGDNIVCLTRYKPQPEADGSWPWQVMEAACTTVRMNGGFTIEAEFGRKGTFFYGLEMGPCRSNAAECGDGDPGLVGVYGIGDKALQLRTT